MYRIIKHVGTPRHSGRYPWGSGKDPEQRNTSFRGQVKQLRKKGMKDTDIAKGFGLSSTEFRKRISIENAEERKIASSQALKLKDKGYSKMEIGRRMGKNESSVRSLLDPALQERSNITRATANILKDAVEKKNYIDVGAGMERHIGVTRNRLTIAVAMLKDEGYTIHYPRIQQVGTEHKTSMLVLAKPGVTTTEVYKNKDKIKMVTDHYTEDGGRSWYGIKPPTQVDSKRISVRYRDEGGKDKDGIIELRRGVEDLSLGKARYAQVRIAVDGTHYLKGMAMYSDDLPKGTDIVFNTNKRPTESKHDAFKSLKKTDTGDIDEGNPFGATVRQRHYKDSSGKERLSPLNIVSSGEKVNEEGRWGEWSRTLSSQILSKQSPELAKKQLNLMHESKKEEHKEIMSLTNATVRKKLLEGFADGCDSESVHLRAAALPRQMSHVILPFPKMKETEIYAPNYRDGEKVVLIRHPHGGKFEIPELTVNNKQRDAKRLIPNALDAVGIHPKVAERLSGADFDGDTVIVIPNPKGPKGGIQTKDHIINFDPREAYPPHDKMITIEGGVYNAKTKEVIFKDANGNAKPPNKATKQAKMGDVSNLITDMTIKGANIGDVEKAVKHSMVVIDSDKHSLDYKKSYVDNGIAALKQRYQGRSNAGASTLISRAASPKAVPFREEGAKLLNPKTGNIRRVYVDPATGKKLYNVVDETYINKKGQTIKRKTKSTKMAEVDDAFKLSSGTAIENVYAEHANKLKALALDARKTAVNTPYTPYSPSAKKTYGKEVASLTAQLNIALKNSPLERQAQLLAGSVISSTKQANPHMTPEELKKVKGQAIMEARLRVGAGKDRVSISPREWEAIQAGAFNTHTLTQILNNTEIDKIKKLATPRASVPISPATISRARTMLKKGYTQAEIADHLGVSRTKLMQVL